MTNQLVELTAETAMLVFTAEKGLDSYVQQVKDEINSFEHDLSTVASRKRTISLAAKVSKIKAKYDSCGKDLVADWKENAKKVDKSRKKMRDELDELKILARKPVTDWEAEQVVIENERLAKIEADKVIVQHEMALLMNKEFDRDLAEEKAEFEIAQKAEAERVENVRIENEARIAKESAEAATAEAERLAQKAIDDAQEQKQKAIDDKIKADNELLASQAREKLLNEQAEQTRINNEWLAYILEAYKHNDALNAQAEQIRQDKIIEQNRLAAIETERLAGIERQRVDAAQKKAAQDKLEANQKHVGSIRGEIKLHLMNACGIDEELAVKVVKALLHTDRVTINY